MKKELMRRKLLIAVAQEAKKNHVDSEQGFLVALDGGDAIQNLQMHPLPVIVHKETFGTILCSFALMQAFKVVSFFLF